MRIVLWAGLALVLLFRLVWLARYFQIAGWRSFKLLTSSLYSASDSPRRDTHQRVASVTESLLDNCVIVGAIAFAAWTALFAVARTPPANELTSTTRGLLLVGAALLITAPILFRQPDRHLSYIGRTFALFVGLEAVGLSLASLARDLLHGPGGLALALVVAIVLVTRDCIDSVNAFRYVDLLIKPGIARLDATKEIQHEPES
jgi:hypothetical protein